MQCFVWQMMMMCLMMLNQLPMMLLLVEQMLLQYPKQFKSVISDTDADVIIDVSNVWLVPDKVDDDVVVAASADG